MDLIGRNGMSAGSLWPIVFVIWRPRNSSSEEVEMKSVFLFGLEWEGEFVWGLWLEGLPEEFSGKVCLKDLPDRSGGRVYLKRLRESEFSLVNVKICCVKDAWVRISEQLASWDTHRTEKKAFPGHRVIRKALKNFESQFHRRWLHVLFQGWLFY